MRNKVNAIKTKKRTLGILLSLLIWCSFFTFFLIRKIRREKQIADSYKVLEKNFKIHSALTRGRVDEEELKKIKAEGEETKLRISKEMNIPIIILVYFGIVGVLVLIVLWYPKKKK